MKWFQTRENDGRKEVFDPIRKKYVALTPEEEVRQLTMHHLVTEKLMPPGLMAVEHSFRLNGLSKRSDLTVFAPDATPLMIVECKAKHVQLNQVVFDQIVRYNMSLNVNFLLITNGLSIFFLEVNPETLEIRFLDNIPTYTQLLQLTGKL